MKTMTLKTILLAAFILALFPLAGNKASASVTNWQKSVTIQPRWNTDFSSDTFKQSVRDAAAMNANMITLVVPVYQSNLYSTDIQAGWNTPTDQSLIDGITYIHSLGLKASVKIHLESNDGQWRAYINPSDRNGWFTAYGSMLNKYATLSQQNHVELLCIAAELINMSTATSNSTNTAQWNTLITNARKLYTGPMTYSANWGGGWFGDEKSHIEFWGSLDYIGISAYFNLNTDNSNTNIQALEDQWNNYNNSEITPLAQKYGKPVLFTEIGYKSIQGAHFEPWNSGRSGSYDATEQVTDFTALFDYWNKQSFMQGVHIWDWNSDPNYGGQGNTDYTPQHKPAYNTISTWFGGNGAPIQNDPPPSSVTCPATATNAFSACYFSDRNLTTAKLTRTDSAINFDWGNGSPDPAIPADNFSARWQGSFTFNAGSYTFNLTGDDGVRLYIDNALVIDKWIDQGPTTYPYTTNVTAGTHAVKVEYYENGGGAVAKLNWTQNITPPPSGGTTSPTCTTATANAFTGCYYDNQDFTNLKVARTDSAINFDWGNGSPDPSIGSDTFSAVWQGNFTFNAAAYNFSITGDDGVRLYIDDQLIIDQFKDQAATTYTVSKTLTQGNHSVKMTYYENGGGAVAKLNWVQNSTTTSPPTPSSYNLNIWWPTDGSKVSGQTPFKAMVDGLDISQYDMYWQVDGDQLVKMFDSQQDYPHKEFTADLSGWNWKGSGPYEINFVAKDKSGNTIAQKKVNIYVQ